MFLKIPTSVSVPILYYRDARPTATGFWHSGRLLARLTGAFLVFVLLLTACSTPAPPTEPPAATEGINITSSSGMVLEQSVEELAAKADHIFIGQVQSVHSDWNADETSIETTVTLSVEEHLKSTTFPRDFTLVLPGGTVGDVSMIEEDTPTFTAGERVLLFLKGDGGPGTLLVGGWQGVYHIEGDEAVQPNVNRRMSLPELKARIRASTATVAPPAYGGAMMLKRSVGELTTEADHILVADVLAIESQFNADGSSINTQVTLAVDKVLKGEANAQETLTLPGGQIGDYGVLVGGVPNFITGERVLLFLDDDSEFAIAGLWQGKYSLSGDEAFQPETGRKVSVASLEQAIGQALASPVEIGTAPEVVHAEFTTGCPAWLTTQSPVPHYVNSANPGSGAPGGGSFVSLMYKSLHAWQNLPNSWVLLQVAGTTTRDATNHNDGFNDIAWDSIDGGGGVLGVNTCVYGGGQRFESDTRFDNSDQWTITAAAGRIDLRSVSEHEFGHGIGLDHSDQPCDGTASTPLMCPAVSSGVRKIILADDSNGAAYLYPLTGAVPAAPSGLSATPAGASNNLSWTDNSSNELAFEIQRASGSCGGTFTGVATVPANTTNYTDNDYGAGLAGTYCYRVKALNRGGDSGFSNTALNSTSPPTAPSGLAATPVPPTQINLSWTDNSNNEDGFKIERSPNGTSGWAQIGTVGANVTTYSNTGLTCDQAYYYRVRAYNANGNSGYSNVVNAIPARDTYEPDNTYSDAKSIALNGTAQLHNFHIAGDEDWVKFAVTAGGTYSITTSNLGANADTYLYLYDTGVNHLDEDDNSGTGLGSQITRTATSGGTYYARVLQVGGEGGCTGYGYDLAVVGPAEQIFLPILPKNYPSQTTTNLYIQNDTGSNMTVCILGIACKTGPPGLGYWGSFPSGTYSWSAQAVCGTDSGTRSFQPGNVVLQFLCGSSAASQEEGTLFWEFVTHEGSASLDAAERWLDVSERGTLLWEFTPLGGPAPLGAERWLDVSVGNDNVP